MNAYSKLLESVKMEKDFLDLTNTNFQTLTPQIKYFEIEDALKRYFDKRSYEPDPRGLLMARKAISKYYDAKSIAIEPENIIITASTSESYSLIFSSLLRSDDKILLPNPSYPLFSYLASYAKVKPLYYDQTEKMGRWSIDLESLNKNISKVKALVLISPNNPTGMMISKQEIESILKMIKGRDILLILDEVFSDFCYEKNEHGLLLKEITKGNKVMLLNGISKSLASPDLKLAWIALPEEDLNLLDELETANDTYLNCSYLTQAILPLLFSKSKDMRKKWLHQLNSNRDLLRNLNNERIKILMPEGGIHCVIDFPALAWENEKIALKLLADYHLAVHPGYFYDFPSESRKVIISLLQDPEKFKNALSRLVEFSIQYS